MTTESKKVNLSHDLILYISQFIHVRELAMLYRSSRRLHDKIANCWKQRIQSIPWSIQISYSTKGYETLIENIRIHLGMPDDVDLEDIPIVEYDSVWFNSICYPPNRLQLRRPKHKQVCWFGVGGRTLEELTRLYPTVRIGLSDHGERPIPEEVLDTKDRVRYGWVSGIGDIELGNVNVSGQNRPSGIVYSD